MRKSHYARWGNPITSPGQSASLYSSLSFLGDLIFFNHVLVNFEVVAIILWENTGETFLEKISKYSTIPTPRQRNIGIMMGEGKT